MLKHHANQSNKPSSDRDVVDLSVDALKQRTVSDLLQSISTHGLRSMKDIPESSMPNASLQSEIIHSSICVNYVNLNQASSNERQLALQSAVFEEYCGIYAIALERQWPFQRLSDRTLRQTEMIERLMSCVVFILAPPTQFPITHTVTGGLRPTPIAFYSHSFGSDSDGFYQSEGKSLITAQKMPYANRITEIKTVHSFAKREWLAILAPEHLVDQVTRLFSGTPIIPVPTKPLTLSCLPDMISRFNGEQINEPAAVHAPDFYSVLDSFTTKENIKQFSIHAVRLHTTFDFIARPLANLAESAALISQAKGEIIKTYTDGSGWISVHKKWGQSKEPLIKRLTETKNIPPHLISSLQRDAAPQIVLCKKLSAAKGPDSSSNYVYSDLNRQQRARLVNAGVSLVRHNHYYAINYPTHKKIEVSRIIEQFNAIQHDSARTIQSTYRGFWARQVIQDYKTKESNLQKAQEELNQARAKLNGLSLA